MTDEEKKDLEKLAEENPCAGVIPPGSTVREVDGKDMDKVLQEADEIIKAKARLKEDPTLKDVTKLGEELQKEMSALKQGIPGTGHYKARDLGMLIPYEIKIATNKNAYLVYVGEGYPGTPEYVFTDLTSLVAGMFALLSFPKDCLSGELVLQASSGVEKPLPYSRINYDVDIRPTHNNGIVVTIGCFTGCFTGIHAFLEKFEYWMQRGAEFENKYNEMKSLETEKYSSAPPAAPTIGTTDFGRAVNPTRPGQAWSAGIPGRNPGS